MMGIAQNIAVAMGEVRCRLWPDRYRYLFILGCMRSGSSLLTHILRSHPRISGFGEAHQHYTSARSLSLLEARIAAEEGRPAPGDYLLDKLLSNRYVLGTYLAERYAMRTIVLLRDPLEVISSMMDFEGLEVCPITGDRVRDFEGYYCARLHEICDTVTRFPDPQQVTMLTYERLVTETEASLSHLQSFLELEAPLRKNYALGPLSGAPVLGDASPHIRSGEVIDTGRKNRLHVSPEQIEAAVACYESVSAYLRRYCEGE